LVHVADLGIKRVISASSNQLYGFAGAPPVFVPVDESHPPRPVNSYALSKLVGEQTAEYFSRTRGLEVLSFRIMGTRTPGELPEETAAMGDDPAGAAWLLWTRTDARDVATACRQAIEVDEVKSGVYNITGPRVAIDTPTMELIAAHFGDKTEIRDHIVGYDSPLSCEKARLAFGYEPKHAWAEGVDTMVTVTAAPASAKL
jgi:nucleoside-diphosphate-sugar epimerase